MAGTTNGTIVLQRSMKIWAVDPSKQMIKETVINYFFRFGSFPNNTNKYNSLAPLSIGAIVKETNLPNSVVLTAALKFLTEASKFSRVLGLGTTSWGAGEVSKLRQSRFFLRKAHKIAPIFDYARAIANLKTLHKLLKIHYYWPHITTQLALTIFVTDRNDSTIPNSEYILQKNLRVFCACSAYAFHDARKKLHIGKTGQVGP